MQILNNNDTLKPDECTVLTVGNFDGVHLGHQALIRETVRRASAKGAKSAVVTFDPPTRLVIGKESGYRLLTTFEEKTKLIGSLGVNYVVRVPFDRAMGQKEPIAFIEEILVSRLRMAAWVLGRGHTFGRNRAGNENFLHTMGSKYHFKTLAVDLLAQDGIVVSSTQIRECIAEGRIEEAVGKLGHPYLILVEHTAGKRLGTAMGYPTLNFRSPPARKVIPPPGVYAAELEYEGGHEEGALYFGECPTLHEHREVHFEFHSFNRGKEEIGTGGRAHLWLHSMVRSDGVFAGTGELAKQIGRDIETIKTFFMKEKVQWR